MINVLFIALEFPPLNVGGVFRPVKFTKYLREFGINPVIVTLNAGDATAIFGGTADPGLLRDVPSDVPVVRTRYRCPSRFWNTRLGCFLSVYFSVQDSIARRCWKDIRRQLPELMRTYQPRAVVATLPPFSAGALGMWTARQLGLPLVIDMRDAWSHWCNGPFGTWVHYYLTLRHERRLFQRARAVVTVTPQLANIFRKSHASLPPEKFHVVPNGYDFDLQGREHIDVPPRDERSTVVVGYVGTFYYDPKPHAEQFTPWWKKRWHRKLQYTPVKEDWLYRSPLFFLRAMASLFGRRPELRGRLRFEVLGCDDKWLHDMAAALNLTDSCVFRPRGPYQEVLTFVDRCDAFLCTSVKVPGGEDYALASKTFEYIRLGKPIVGFCTPGAQRDFLLGSGLGLVCDADDTETGAMVLERVVAGGFRLDINRSYLERYHRRALAKQMAAIIQNVAGPSSTAPRLSAPFQAVRATNAS